MVKFPEAMKRIFGNVFVCRKCKTKMKVDPTKVMRGMVKCKKCSSRALRPIRKK